ncbi:MAG: DMT family transporter, partial [Candidatus Eisenbacteria bacterium]|nr:DMT family transporter [Candidatus Eisenbacteria bacterium]
MVPFLMALASSMVYGVADFLGGMGSRRAHVFTVTAWFQLTGVFLLVGYALLAPGITRPTDLAWAAGSGVAGGLGVTLLYHVLAIGTVSTAAPLVSMVALTVPVIVGLATGERPGVLPLAGIALGALAVWLVSGDGSHGAGGTHEQSASSPLRTLGLAVLAGLLIGGFLVLLSHVQPGSSGWPLVGIALGALAVWLVSGDASHGEPSHDTKQPARREPA